MLRLEMGHIFLLVFLLTSHRQVLMKVSEQDASDFIQGYTLILTQIGGFSVNKRTKNFLDKFASARSKLCSDRSLLNSAVDKLMARSIDLPPEVVKGMESIEVKQWVYLKDTRTHSVFIDPSNQAAYGVLGLTERIRNIIGGSGAFVETGLLQYKGRFITDGIISSLVWLGRGIKQDYAEILSEIKSQGTYYSSC
ncbi:MAG: hypothetical protein HQL44_09835 [Alphaproteobacteria bacterium]|nr:hypothetical protein [Alphaproteobacteria bacterium]